MIQAGQAAPDFNLPDTEKNMQQLSSYKGKNVLLLFYPFAFTGVCTKELCNTRDDIAFYQGMNAEVFGISVDSPFANAKFKEEQKINFPLLSDFNKEASTAFDCLYESFVVGLKGVSKRSAFIIDKDGIVQYAEVLENAGELPNFEAIKKCLEGLN
jgi:glutaredoxin-dependent peroxiredoxin